MTTDHDLVFLLDVDNTLLDNDEIVSAVLKKFPDAKTNKANVSWYRSQAKAGN